jgi:hypothetical protein
VLRVIISFLLSTVTLIRRSDRICPNIKAAVLFSTGERPEIQPRVKPARRGSFLGQHLALPPFLTLDRDLALDRSPPQKNKIMITIKSKKLPLIAESVARL